MAEELDLLRVAERAGTRAGIPGREEQIAYCLAALMAKAERARSRSGDAADRYGLDPQDADFPDQLAGWADTIARNLRTWGHVYQAIHDEARRYELTTLRRVIRTHPDDDVIDVIADRLTDVLGGGPDLDAMSLERMREVGAAPGDYVFQSPLGPWIATVATRLTPWDADELDEEVSLRDLGDVVDDLETGQEVSAEAYRVLIERIAALAETRGLLSARIERADRLEAGLARRGTAAGDLARLFVRLRAELVYVSDALSREQRALPRALAYIVLALRPARQLQCVAILSLRLSSIEPAAVEAIAVSMRETISDDMQPTPDLVQKTHDATERGVPGSRADALDELRAAPERRAEILRPVARLLDALPGTVADGAELAAIAGCNANVARVNRGAAARELSKVDALFGRVFRRYAMGSREHER